MSADVAGGRARPFIRAGRPEDAAAVAALLHREIHEGYAHFGAEAPPVAELARALAEGGPLPFLVAEVEGAFAGFLRASPWKEREGYAWTVELGAYVVPGARSRGVGAVLLAAALDELRARGYRRVLAGVALPNPASVAVAERAGFVKVAELPGVGWKAGAWRSVGYWMLQLGGDEPPAGRPG